MQISTLRSTRRLIAALATALLLAGCAPGAFPIDQEPPVAPPATPAPQPNGATPVPAPSAEIAAMEQEVMRRVNEIRREHGRNALEHHEPLAGVARAYSCRMEREGFFSHVSPDGQDPASRVSAAGISYLAVGENIARTVNAPQPVDIAVQGWLESEGHRENMLRDVFTHTGVGICRDGPSYHFTQLFMRPR